MKGAWGLRASWAGTLAALMLLVTLCAGHAAELTSLRIEGEAANFPIGESAGLALLHDKSGGLGIDDVSRRDDFRPLSDPASHLGLAPGTRWYRFTALRGAGMPGHWILAFGEPDMDDVRVFVPAPDGGFLETRLGRRIPSRQLPLAARLHVAAIDLPEAVPATVYIRLASERKIRFEDPALWRPDALLFEETRQSTIVGLHTGILAVIVTVYALFGLWLRDGVMLIYATYVATIICRSITHSGIVAVLFPQSGGDTNYLLMGGGLLGGVAAFIFMWDKILDLRANFPRMHRLYTAVGTLVALCLLSVLTPVFPHLVRPAQSIMLAFSICSVALAIMLAQRNPKDGLIRFYLCAFLPVVLVWATEVAALASPQVPLGLGRQLDQVASMTHIAILSVALAYRLRRNQREQMHTQVALAGERLARQRLRTFIDMATHEFKTPLAVIDSAAQVLELLTGPERPGITDRLATIRRAVLRLVRLIETCLAGERDTELAPQLVAPADMLKRVAERNLEPERGALIVEASGLPATCLADGDLLGIALDALIDNARRYGPADQPIEIAAHGEGGHITFAVHDRGPGIPAGEASRIFEKYFRGSSSASIAGTGIGLHLVKTIAELHGGHIRYQPRDGGGASFLLAIPAR